jgi:protocatechuate 3,4-dioxygenase beta subunit
VIFAVLFLATCALPVAAAAQTGSDSYTFTGVWQGQPVNLTQVTNVTVEGLPDAKLVGQITDFQTNEPTGGSPPFYELNGESINVWTAPAEFPGVYVVHNGDQGTQATYGTWTFPMTNTTGPTMPYSLALRVSPSSLPADGSSTATVTATVTGANGQPVSNDTVDFTASSGTVASSATTNSGGQATATYTAGTAPGNVTVSATETAGSAAGSATLTLTAPAWTFTGVWQGQTVNLTQVANVTVEGLSDAKLVGQITGFQTNESTGGSPPFYELNGESINVWTAPAEFPGVYVVHNGDQGTQATYGTWTFPMTNTTGPTMPYSLALRVSPSSLPADGSSTATVTATVTGANGQPVSNDTVDFTASSGTVASSATTNSGGQATATYTAGTAPGNVTVSATETAGSAAGSATLTLTAPAWTFTGVWQGQTVNLTQVPNVTVEGLPDAKLVGQITGFQTNESTGGSPPFYELNGESINVWTAPAEFPGVYVVHNGDQGQQATYGTWTFPMTNTQTVVGYKVSAPAQVDFGAPFTFNVTAVDANGNTVTTADNTVDLTSSTNNVLFTNATLTSGQSATVTLTNGVSTVDAVDNVPESVTINVADNSGNKGSAQLTVVIGPHLLWRSPGVSMSINGGTPQTVADIDFIDYDNGVDSNGCHGGFWPLGVGTTYTATWNGYLNVTQAGSYQFLNVADDRGSATITVNGLSQTIPTNSWTQGTNAPLSIQLTTGSYAISVSQQETDGQGGAGDTLKWNPPGGSGLVPIPASTFGSGIKPIPLPINITFTIDRNEYISDGTGHTMDVAPFIKHGRTYVPVRYIGYAIGMSGSDISWDSNNDTATFSYAGKTVEFTLGSKTYTINGEPNEMDVIPIDLNGRIFIPVRFVGDAFGYSVSWNASTRKVRFSRS